MAFFRRYYDGPLDYCRKVVVVHKGIVSPPKYYEVVKKQSGVATKNGDVYWDYASQRWIWVDPNEDGFWPLETQFDILMRPAFNNQVTIE